VYTPEWGSVPRLLVQSRWTGKRLQVSHSASLPTALLQQDVMIYKDGPAGNSYLRPPEKGGSGRSVVTQSHA